MITIDEKLNVLSKIAKELNRNNITWAIGGSLLLYFKGITKEFNDIDIMISEGDIETIRKILLSFGILKAKNPNTRYKSKEFMQFNIEGVDFDVIAGFTIVKDNLEYYFPLEKKDIKEYINIGDVVIPLDSLGEWWKYYKLMDRKEKVEMIHSYFEVNKSLLNNICCN